SGLDVRHVFDATGRRLWKIGPTGSTRFVWDGDTLIAEVPTAGGSTVSYVTVPDAEAPCWMSTGGRRIALLTEPNGYPLVAVAADGTEIADDPDPYGVTALGAAEARRQPLRFAGQYAGAEKGLHYNRHRCYDPETGRYLPPDPLGIDGGLNAYSYPSAPLNLIDPLGLSITVLQKMGPNTPQVRKKTCDKKPKRKKRKKTPISASCNTSRGGSIHNDCINMMDDAATNAGMQTRTDCPHAFGGGKSNPPHPPT